MHSYSFNLAVIAGRLTQEPEFRTCGRKHKGESQLVRFTVATNYLYQPAGTTDPKEWKEHACFHRIVFFGKRAVWISDRASKGDLVLVYGRLDNNVWVDPSGIKRRITQIQGQELVFLAKPKKSAAKQAPEPEPDEPEQETETPDKEAEDEAPF